jgi:hypothetical protein
MSKGHARMTALGSLTCLPEAGARKGEEGKKVVGSPKAVEVTDNGRMSVRTVCHIQKRRGVSASSATSSVSRFRRQVPSIRYTCKD